IDAAVVNARFAKPLDEELILRMARETGGVLTAEENVRAGGFGEAVLTLLSEHGLADKFLGALTMPDAVVDHGPQATFRKLYKLDAEGIAETAREVLERRRGPSESDPLASLTPA